MDNKEFNVQRHNRKKQLYRFLLGVQQLLNLPALNLIWLVYAFCVWLLVIAEKRYLTNIVIYPLFETVFIACMKLMLILFPILCAIGLIQLFSA